MFPQRVSRSEFPSHEPVPDPSQTLEQHIAAGFPPDLALDLVLNEIVVRAAEATRADSAALALIRGNDCNDNDGSDTDCNDDEMVCRAATGRLAPGLGIPLKPRDGLSGACLQSRKPQLSVDTECDPRVDPDISRRLGIRSILAVPVFDAHDNSKFAGVLEVFSTSPAAFSNFDQRVLEAFAEDCARVRQVALETGKRIAAVPTEFVLPRLVSPDLKPASSNPPDLIPADFTPPNFTLGSYRLVRRSFYENCALIFGALTIFAVIGLGLLVASRFGWLGTSRPAKVGNPEQAAAPERNPVAATVEETSSASENLSSKGTGAALERAPVEMAVPGKKLAKASRISSTTTAAGAGDLVVYEKGKVVFRLKPGPTNQVIAASSIAKLDPATNGKATAAAGQRVHLSSQQAEARLLSRTEPDYPIEALMAHRAGTVVLEVQVADDGSVSHVRPLTGDPALAAAAGDAVRTWRYQPYLQHDHAFPFQTDVTLTFVLPD